MYSCLISHTTSRHPTYGIRTWPLNVIPDQLNPLNLIAFLGIFSVFTSLSGGKTIFFFSWVVNLILYSGILNLFFFFLWLFPSLLFTSSFFLCLHRRRHYVFMLSVWLSIHPFIRVSVRLSVRPSIRDSFFFVKNS